MRIPVLTAALAAMALSCAGDTGPTPIGDLDLTIEPRSLDLGTYTYETRVFPSVDFLFSNNSNRVLYIVPGFADAEGDGAELLSSDFLAYSQVQPAQTRPVGIDLDRRAWRWSTGDYSVQLPLEVSYFYEASSGVLEVESPLERVADVTSGDARITINWSVDCDLDDDGFDAIVCGGQDCDDKSTDTRPDAQEDCNTVADDDCDGSFNDPDALNRTLYYADEDGDGYGDDDTTVERCNLPPGKWALRGGDCNDDDPLEDPGSSIERRCSDGRDDDCDGLVDNLDPDCGG